MSDTKLENKDLF